MDFALGHEQKLLIKTVRQFVQTELQPLEAKGEDSDILESDEAKRIFEKSYALYMAH
jgi:hypothetical protein